MLTDGYALSRIRREQTRDMVREVARWRLRRDAGLIWQMQFKRSTCRILCRLGRALVVLGKQLEQYSQPRLAAQ